MKLSIIICLYNSDKALLEECISSITRSTLAPGAAAGIEYEICAYDDGSSIDYSDIVERYGLKYKRAENKGIFGARLAALDMAEGEYIAFVDSDDTVSFNYHRPMVEKADALEADIIINDWAFNTRSAKYYCSNDNTISDYIDLDGDACLEAFLSQEGIYHSWYVLWNKIYRASLLREVAGIVASVAEEHAPFNYSEDALMNFHAFRLSKKVMNLHTGYYFYRIHDSQSVNVISEERLRRQIDCMTTTLDNMRAYIPEGEKQSELLSHIDAWGAMMCRSHYSHARAAGYEALYPYIKEKYGADELRRATHADGRCYTKHALLPRNSEARDEALLKLWLTGADKAKYPKMDSYVAISLDYIGRMLGREINYSRGAAVRIPRRRIKLRSRIIHNYAVFKIGMLLFKKGSRIRNFLKKWA